MKRSLKETLAPKHGNGRWLAAARLLVPVALATLASPEAAAQSGAAVGYQDRLNQAGTVQRIGIHNADPADAEYLLVPTNMCPRHHRCRWA